jgi:hypothetical protein
VIVLCVVGFGFAMLVWVMVFHFALAVRTWRRFVQAQ